DWRKIERLLRQVVTNIYDTRSRQLSQTIHSISVRNILLENENNRLKEALVNEKKKRQRGKPLLLEAPSQYDGGAIFWSPQKVQEARDRQCKKDAEEEALQHQKDLDKIERAHKKAEKARMLEERKRTQAMAKEIKLQKQAEKQLQKLAKKTPKARSKSSKNVVKSKAITIESSTDDEQVDEVSDDEVSLIEMGAATPARSRRDRIIKLPSKFRE
ncbi:hypothetical protein P154DRAFT_438325, partial [Amniculicola lignicola CBS 123094]